MAKNISRGYMSLETRGGVEATRLKAKDTKKSEAKAKESPSEDRHSRGQGQEYARGQGPRTQTQGFFKKKIFKKFFQDSLSPKTTV